MRILVLGAAGRAGRAVLSSLLGLSGVEAVLLADGDAEGLGKMASQRSPFPLHLRYLDASDPRSLRERLSEADLALGCLGPFHRHEVEIFQAVLETGCDYLSLCDDSSVTREILSRWEEAEARGSRVILGCGMAPGLSNLLALRAASRLDRVDRLGFFWRLEGLSSLGWGTIQHLAHSLSGKAVVAREGREERVRAGGWPEAVDFPPPAGPAVAYYLDRPEPLTVSRALEGVKEAFFKAGMGRQGEDLLLQVLSRIDEEGYAGLLMNLFRLAGGRTFAAWEGLPCPACLRVTAEGRRGGEHRVVHLAACGDYYRLTGAVAAAAVAWIRATPPPPGVYTPEEAWVGGHTPRRLAFFLASSGARLFLAEERRVIHQRARLV